MSDSVDDEYTPNLENSLPRAAYEAMQNDNPDHNNIADALERFGHLETVREWAIEALRAKRPRHRPKASYRIYMRQLENGLRALETGSGFLDTDERTTRRHKAIAKEYLDFAERFIEEIRKLNDADKKS